MRKYGKFGALMVIIIGTLVWLATAGMKETKTYYKTIEELTSMGDRAHSERLRVAGDVAPGSIVRKNGAVEFLLVQDNVHKLRVSYSGSDPLPDTFREATLPKFRPDGLLIVHAGGGAGLFSAIIGGWVNGATGSQPVTREVLT